MFKTQRQLMTRPQSDNTLVLIAVSIVIMVAIGFPALLLSLSSPDNSLTKQAINLINNTFNNKVNIEKSFLAKDSLMRVIVKNKKTNQENTLYVDRYGKYLLKGYLYK